MVFMRLIYRGAEAELFEVKRNGKKMVVKNRLEKKYRRKELDKGLREKRTKKEANLIRRVRELGIVAPDVYSVNKQSGVIEMEFIEGRKLRDCLNERNISLCREIGRMIGVMHLNGIIHGDLTTSNIILRKKGKKNELVFIDFGLGQNSNKIEDKAVDLIVFKKTFLATHFKLKKGWALIRKGYMEEGKEGEKVLKHMEAVEKRGRYL